MIGHQESHNRQLWLTITGSRLLVIENSLSALAPWIFLLISSLEPVTASYLVHNLEICQMIIHMSW